MSFRGDLYTIALGDLLQNIEAHQRTGTLHLYGGDGDAYLYVEDGALALFASAERPSLAVRLKSSGCLEPVRGPVAEAGVGDWETTATEFSGPTEEELYEAAEESLAEDICHLLSTATGEFEFMEGPPPPEMFDPKEQELELRVSVGPLLLEAARRAEQWQQIREYVDSDAICFVKDGSGHWFADSENPELTEEVLASLDGTTSVREVRKLFPGRDFDVYQALAYLAQTGRIRATTAEELSESAHKLEHDDAHEARRLVSLGLERDARRVDLLELATRLAERPGSPFDVEVFCTLSRIQAGQDNTETAFETLNRAYRLDPLNARVRESIVNLALAHDRLDDAVREGMELLELYHAANRPDKARELLERLRSCAPGVVEVRCELARCSAATGEIKSAVDDLLQFGRSLVQETRLNDAHRVFAELLQLDPASEAAAEEIARVDEIMHSSRRRRRRQRIRWASAFGLVVISATIVTREVAARIAYVRAAQVINDREFIEQRQYQKAIECFIEVCEEYPGTITAMFDIPRHLSSWRRKNTVQRGDTVEPDAGPGSQPYR